VSVEVAQDLIDKAISELEVAVPIDNPLLWAARCSMDAAALLLRAADPVAATAENARDLVLEAIGAARAAAVAATFAAV
jgi:hypothetical protein